MSDRQYKTSQRRRAFGQHFLTNPQIAGKIVRLAGVSAHDTVLEIGPGRGILTDALLKKGCRVVAVEKDSKLAAALQERYAHEPRLELHEADFLTFDLSPFTVHPSPLKVVANLPYAVATEIIFKLIDHRQLCSDLTVMVQKEVAERLVAPPGRKDYGVLSVLTQLYSESRIVMRLSPGAFQPPPKIDSAVLRMRLTDKPRVAIRDEGRFKRLVKQAFATRRKMLKNALQIKDEPAWQAICAELGIDPKARAETLSLRQFAALSERWRQ